MARPKGKNNKIKISLSLKPEICDKITEIADKKKLSKSETVEILIKKATKK